MEETDEEENISTLLNNTAISGDSTLFGKAHKEYLLPQLSTGKSDKMKKRLTFAAFALVYFTMSASYSVIAPFYPNEAKTKGVSGEIVGLIFGIFALVAFIFSPVVGILVPIVGIRFLLFSGLFTVGGAQFLFGFLDRMPNSKAFVIYSFILRSFDGAGGAAAMTAAVSCLAQCFPNNIGTVMGGLELFSGIGLTLGPLIGGVLYEYGGFGLPFFVLAGTTLAALPVIMCVLPSRKQGTLSPAQTTKFSLTSSLVAFLARVYEDTSQGTSNGGVTNKLTMKKVLKIPAFDIMAGTIIFGGMAIGIVEPTLAPHLKSEFNITSGTKIGLIFLVFCGTYSLFAPIFGWVADKTNARLVMTFGFFLCGISFLLLGPVPFSFMPKSIWLVAGSMASIGFSLGPCFVPAISEMERIVKANGYPDDLTTHGIISGIYGFAYNIGAFIGPTLSGVFTEYLHFSWTCTGFGLLLLMQSVVLLILTLSGSSQNSNKTKDLENSSKDVFSALVNEDSKTIQA